MNTEAKSKNTSRIIIAVVITAIVVGGGIYWYWSQNSYKEYAELDRVTVKHQTTTEGHLILIKTKELYPDSCYVLRCNEKIDGSKITVNLQNKVYKYSRSGCLDALAQAGCSFGLDLEDGTYTIEINETDIYTLEVSGDTSNLQEDSTSFSSLE